MRQERQSKTFNGIFSAAALGVASALIPAPTTVRAEPRDQTLYGAIAVVDATPPVGVPLGGYGSGARRLKTPDFGNQYPYATFFTPSTGTSDPIRIKALILQKGSKRLLFLGLDSIGVTTDLRDDLAKRLSQVGFRDSELIITATHTHSGPGTLTRDLLWSIIGMDLFVESVYRGFVSRAVDAVEKAYRALEPVELLASGFTARDIQINRRGKPGHFDPEAHLLMMRSTRDGRWLGGMANLAVHGTSLPEENLNFSADTPGAIEHVLSSRLDELNQLLGAPQGGAQVLFVNGAEGDVSPSEKGLDGMQLLGTRFADQALAALPSARLLRPEWELRFAKVPLGPLTISTSACKPHAPLPVIQPRPRDESTQLTALKLDDIWMVGWPGEPTTDLGLETRRIALSSGAREGWVLGLTNDHKAYFTTPQEYSEGGYEACMTFYGPEAGGKLTAAIAKLLH